MDGMYKSPMYTKIISTMRSLTSAGIDVSMKPTLKDEALQLWMDWLRDSPDQKNVRYNYVWLGSALVLLNGVLLYSSTWWPYPLLSLLAGFILYYFSKSQIATLEAQKNTLRWSEKGEVSFKQRKIDFIGLVFDIKSLRIKWQRIAYCLLFPLIPHLVAKFLLGAFAFDNEWISLLSCYLFFVPAWHVYFSADLKLLTAFRHQAIGHGGLDTEVE